ncbi:MAG: RluA family pseudouridine synthase [Candidatus Binatia bacterium]
MIPNETSIPILDACKHRFGVPLELDGRRLDLVLARLTGETRSQIKILVDERRVWVEGTVAKAGRLVKRGEMLEVLPLPPTPSTVEPQSIPLDILFEDEHLAAINKPPGMVVHPAPGQWDGTVVNALLFRWGVAERSTTLRPGIVHRLDKDTSGVLLIAKDLWTLEQLSCAFKERRVHKTYLAVVVGHLRASSGTIELPIGRHPVNRKKMAVRRHGGREAVSRYQLIAETTGLSLLRLFPKTGRTHQLRVHLAAIGHPIVGDHLYGGDLGNVRNVSPIARTFARQALHAEQIEFLHPMSGAPLCLCAPYPQDFLCLLEIFYKEAPTKKIESFLLTGKKGSTIIRT